MLGILCAFVGPIFPEDKTLLQLLELSLHLMQISPDFRYLIVRISHALPPLHIHLTLKLNQ
jgi:hypothetical protein